MSGKVVAVFRAVSGQVGHVESGRIVVRLHAGGPKGDGRVTCGAWEGHTCGGDGVEKTGRRSSHGEGRRRVRAQRRHKEKRGSEYKR